MYKICSLIGLGIIQLLVSWNICLFTEFNEWQHLASSSVKHTSDAPTVQWQFLSIGRIGHILWTKHNIKPKTLFLYFVYMLFLSEGLIDAHVLHIIMSKKLENYRDWFG